MKGYLSMALAAICLATIGLFVKLIGNSIPVMTLNFSRIFIAFIFLLSISPFIDKNFHKIKKKELKHYIIIGFLFAVALSMFNIALLLIPMANTYLLDYTFPFFVAILSYFFLKEKITKPVLIAIIIAFLGVAIINPLEAKHLTGNVIVLMQAFVYGALIVYMRHVRKTEELGSTIWYMFFGSLFLLPFPFIFGLGNILSVLHWIFLLGVVSTGLAYLFFNHALKYITAPVASLIDLILDPIFAIIIAFFILKESLSVNVLFGGSLILLAGVIFYSRKLFKYSNLIK